MSSRLPGIVPPVRSELPFGLERAPSVIAVVIGSLIIAALSGRAPWWVGPIVGVVLATSVVARVKGRTLAQWTRDWNAFSRGLEQRARARAGLSSVREVVVPAGICGVRAAGDTMVAMIQLAPNLDLPTVISESSTFTEDTVPVVALAGMLDHFGIAVDIDVVTTGRRVRPTGSYGLLYDQLIGSHPVVGNRLTWLVVRLDLERNLGALGRRGAVATAGANAVATAAHRIATHLRQHGMAAHALPAEHLREATKLLHVGVNLDELEESWTRLRSPVTGRCVTSYWVDLGRLRGASIDECWAAYDGYTTLTVSLTGADTRGSEGIADRPEVRAIVRYVGAELTNPPLDALLPLAGRQSDALLASLPGGAATARDVVTADPDLAPETSGLTIPIGPSGQILGAISGKPRHTLAMPLYDPARFNTRRRTIGVHAELPVAQQIVLRAAVVGADVEIHTERPQRWQQLVTAVGDPQSLRLAHDRSDGLPPATIAVFDNLVPTSTTAHTTISLVSEPGSPPMPATNLSIKQVSANAVNVSIPMHTVRVDLIEPMGETRYLDPTNSATEQSVSAGYPVAPPIGR